MPAPSFVIMHRGQSENPRSQQNPLGSGTVEDEVRGQNMAGQIEALVNDLMRSFMHTFSSNEFLRMSNQYAQFNPRDFMSNFNQNFEGDAFFELARRISEREAEAR